jgi:DNA replication protein
MPGNFKFSGFSTNDPDLIPIPAEFFRELLPEITNPGELKLILYFLWQTQQMDTLFPFLSQAELLADEGLIAMLTGDNPENPLETAIQAAVDHNILFAAFHQDEAYYFLNDAPGRAAHEAASRGEWSAIEAGGLPADYLRERTNIFRMYEENIAPLTPMVADMLKDAESLYPVAWIEEAMRIAVENNKRSWRYIEAILKRWQEEGKDERKNRKNAQKDRRDDPGRDYSDLIKH